MVSFFIVLETSDEENKVYSYVTRCSKDEKKAGLKQAQSKATCEIKKRVGVGVVTCGWESPGINFGAKVAIRSSLTEESNRGPERQVDGSAHAAQNWVISAFRGGFQVCSRDRGARRSRHADVTFLLTLAMLDCGTANPAMGARCKGASVPMADPLPDSLLCMSRTLLTMQTTYSGPFRGVQNTCRAFDETS